MESKCEHIKVYNNKILASWPPQQDWICRKCGEKGREIVGPPATFANEYDHLVEKFEKKDS